MSDNNNNNNNAGEEPNSSSARKRKADGSDPSPRGKKLGNDLLATLENPDLCDVTLVGSDGGRVPAVRIYLSARSEMLQSLLVGQFREASEEEVRMDYPAAVLKAIVHFCCTDEVPDICTLDADIVESIRLAIKLVDAADYCGLDLLKKKTQTAVVDALVNSEMKDDPQVWGRFTCSAFEEASQKPALEKVCRFLYKAIVFHPIRALVTGDRPGATLLSSTNLRTIVEEPAIRARTLVIYEAIKLWHDNDAPIDEETLESDEDRRSFAKHLTSNLELRIIQPTILLGPVSDSGLVNQDKIMQALQSQCRGGILGIHGCHVDGDGTSMINRSVNGFYEEIPVNANFEMVPADDETRVSGKRRFDKITDPANDEIKITIIFRVEGRSFAILAPPAGAGSIVMTGDYNKIVENNRFLYTGLNPNRFTSYRGRAAAPAGLDVKWKTTEYSDDIVKQTKSYPQLVIGPTLTTTRCILQT